MAQFEDVRSKVHGLLGVPAVPSSKATAKRGLEAEADVAGAQSAGRTSRFSPFSDQDLDQATELASHFMRIARDAPGSRIDKLDAVTADAADQERQLDPGLVRHALMLFMTHDPVGRAVAIPSLLQRSFAPSRTSVEQAPAGMSDKGERGFNLGGGSTPPEHFIDWFREDPLGNEHHEHWHLVYPRRGVPRADSGPGALRERHGELFFYMHRQMLARYDAERLPFKELGPVQPLDDYRAPIPQGYDPGQLVVNGVDRFVPRPSGAKLRDLPLDPPSMPRPYPILEHEWRRDRMFDAAHSGYLRKGEGVVALTGHAGSDLLGKTSENTIASVSAPNPWSYYGNHHGMGHMLIGGVDPEGDGVIVSTATAIRDPAFWRWHKHIDNINFAYQEAQSPHDFSDAPKVLMRRRADESEDLIVCLASDIPGANSEGFDFAAMARHAFGDTPGPNANRNWSTPSAEGEIAFNFEGKKQTLKATSSLFTEMRTGEFKLSNGQTYSYPYLWHEPFFYALRVENLAPVKAPITVRLFLAPASAEAADASLDQRLNDRRAWIEMDKFSITLEPRARTVVARSDTESAIIRRPAILDPDTVTDIDDPRNERPVEAIYCECGWPYHLLLPRGTEAGMQFKLLAILTDGNKDAVPKQGKCGSMSFCGGRDDYPDQRPMGYPFDRPLALPVSTLVAANSSMAMRSIRIVRRPLLPS